MRDFTMEMYGRLLRAIKRCYPTATFAQFAKGEVVGRCAILRHDVDRRVAHAIDCSASAAAIGLRGTFYFRLPRTFDAGAITAIHQHGHEIGYHYEVVSKARGDLRRAKSLFVQELQALRELAPIETACMHGAPLSPYDNRELWQVARLEEFGLVGEPYVSLRNRSIGYLTDTGRGWNRFGVSVRDQVGQSPGTFRSTEDVIAAAEGGHLPDVVMITFHPERWHRSRVAWLADCLVQEAKNPVKRVLKTVRERTSR